MKKTIAFLLACLMLLSMAACGEKSETPSTPADDTSDIAAAQDTTSPDGEEAQESTAEQNAPETDSENSNLSIDYTSLDELNAALGSKLCHPQNASIGEEAYQLVNENGVDIAQYYFVADDIPCGLRFSSDLKTDISGATTEDGKSLFDGVEGEATTEYEGCKVARFFTADGQYVLVVATTDETIFQTTLEDIKRQTESAESEEAAVSEE